MRKNVFLYLFVFAALIALFLLMKGNKMQETNNLKIEKLKTELTLFKDSLQQTQFRLMDLLESTKRLRFHIGKRKADGNTKKFSLDEACFGWDL